MKGLVNRRGGIAAPNLFQVVMPSVAGGGHETSHDINILCEATSIPGRNIDSFGHNVGALKREMPTRFSPSPSALSLTFLLLNDYGSKKFFDTWQSRVVDKNSYELGYADDFCFDFSIYQLNREVTNGFEKDAVGVINDFRSDTFPERYRGDYVYGVRIENAFPKTIQSVQLSSTTNNEVARLNVEFSYTDWFVL